MSCCDDNKPDFMYPLLADIYFPIVEQQGFGDVKKTWILDKTITCQLSPIGKRSKNSVSTEELITIGQTLNGITKTDVRFSKSYGPTSITNIILSNVRGADNKSIYLETSGVRAGKPTLFEISSVEPMVNPFGRVDYYRIVIKRSENQGMDI